MTIEEFDRLEPGDMVQHTGNKTIKIVVEKRASEPITQITKDTIKPNFMSWKVLSTKRQHERAGK